MSAFTTTKRVLLQTSKQIDRTGWLAWASILVVSLAFFIATVFLMMAYVSNKFLQSIENEPHIYIFFKQGTPEDEVFAFKNELLNLDTIERVEYTSEDGAVSEYLKHAADKGDQVREGIKNNERKLPSSLGIRLYSIQDAEEIIKLVQTEQETNPSIMAARYSKDQIDTIKGLFEYLRLGGGIMIALLIIVIFLFTLLTVEFRTFMRSEELGIMQLVGGSLWFIRSPFILEGAFYGFIGSFISTATIYTLVYIIFYVNKSSSVITFLYNFFGDLRWPEYGPVHFAAIFIGIVAFGTFIGAFNSFIAIRRYIN